MKKWVRSFIEVRKLCLIMFPLIFILRLYYTKNSVESTGVIPSLLFFYSSRLWTVALDSFYIPKNAAVDWAWRISLNYCSVKLNERHLPIEINVKLRKIQWNSYKKSLPSILYFFFRIIVNCNNFLCAEQKLSLIDRVCSDVFVFLLIWIKQGLSWNVN